jgi:hypothetical protein
MPGSRRNGVFRWALVAGGRVVGTWKRIRRTRYVLAEVSEFEPLPNGVREQVRGAIEAWGRFAGVEVRVAGL